MAQKARFRLKRPALWAAAALALLVLGFPFAAWIGSSVPVNTDFVEAKHGVTIMVETNGAHTGIIVPVVNVEKDWRETFPSAAMPRSDGQLPTHLAIGWGEREVFLNVPTWGDLKPGTALRIATMGGDPLMRVSHYVRPAPGPNYRPLVISSDQYRALVSAIESGLPDPGNAERGVLKGTYAEDAYYEATGTYTLANTCNSWVGETLAEAGVKMGWWTPFAGGVMKWIPEPQASSA